VTFTMPFDEELFALAMDHSSSPELPALKKRFAGFSICKDMATAAAFGYLAAMRDAEKQEEKEEEEVTVFDQVCAVMEQLLEGQYGSCSEEAVDLTMGIIYNWLHKQFIKEGYSGPVFDTLAECFGPFVKPGVIH
jgi:hypothetical protein